LLGALPYIAAILNKERQILFSNEAFLQKMGLNMDKVLGMRPGEALNCKNAGNMKAGCGTSASCQVCGMVNTVLKSLESGRSATDECRVRIGDRDGYEDCLDLEVTTIPFRWNRRDYVVLTARDISSEKRKEALERIFFHDVINTAGTLQGVVDLLKQVEDPEKIRTFIDLLSAVSRDLTEEILNQKALLAAENGELVLKMQKFYLKETLGHIVKEYKRNELALNKEILLVEGSGEITIHTDPVLLRRVISNMIKNSLEAINAEERVTVDCISTPDSVIVSVQNPGTMSEATKKQVFQRSFSTKGKGRGLGTYSMKLLGEKYLGGKVTFSSSLKEGTIFRLELPLS
jgi:signal transduction histidine kinase